MMGPKSHSAPRVDYSSGQSDARGLHFALHLLNWEYPLRCLRLLSAQSDTLPISDLPRRS